MDNPKRVILGTKPIVLRLFKSGNNTNVFACSDHPTIIHSTHQKLLFSNVNVKVNTMQCNTIQYNAMQCNTIQYNTIQYNTILYSRTFDIELSE